MNELYETRNLDSTDMEYQPWVLSYETCIHGKKEDECNLCEAEAAYKLIKCPNCKNETFVVGDGCYRCFTLDVIQHD